MPSLLSLPRELRDEIWDRACHSTFPPHDLTTQNRSESSKSQHSSSHSLLQTNRQIYHEAAPYMYETTVANLAHPQEVLPWIHTIGFPNSACIHHLVLKFTSLSFEQSTDGQDARNIWSASLQLLPNLQSLSFNYTPKDYKEPCVYSQDEVLVSPTESEASCHELPSLPRPETLKIQRRRSNDVEWRDLQPDFRTHSITNAVLAIHEPMPAFLVLCFSKLLKLSSARSLEQNITCLPTDFLAGLGFYPTRTYALTEGPPSMVFTYRKLDAPPQWPITPAADLNMMLSQLPQLSSLRLGCRKVDSSILSAIPSGVKILDIAFTDPNPTQIAANLLRMRSRCDKLVILTIAVSPLHDEMPLREGESLEDQALRMEAEADYWEPFWEALSHIQNTGVRIWEGEGAGFRKFTRQNTAPSPVLPML